MEKIKRKTERRLKKRPLATLALPFFKRYIKNTKKGGIKTKKSSESENDTLFEMKKLAFLKKEPALPLKASAISGFFLDKIKRRSEIDAINKETKKQ